MPINIVSEMHTGTLPDVNSTQLFFMDVERFLDSLPQEPIFDLVVTSPPYNIGKEYENQVPLTDYVAWQKRIREGCLGDQSISLEKLCDRHKGF